MTRIDQDKTLLETASGKKSRRRGRPDVYATSGIDDEGAKRLRDAYSGIWPYEPNSRSMTNLHYVLEGRAIAIKTLDEKTFDELFTPRKTHSFKNISVLEQIGRMRLQDHYNEKACMEWLQEAVNCLQYGLRSHDIANQFRKIRVEYQKELKAKKQCEQDTHKKQGK